MIPAGGSIANTMVEEVQQPSRTYKLDFARGRVAGMTDGLDAVKQAAFKILQTDRYQYEIYSFNYGHELNRLIGGDPRLVRSEASRMIREALLQDDRITSVSDIQVMIGEDSLMATFTVISDAGRFEQEVRIGV